MVCCVVNIIEMGVVDEFGVEIYFDVRFLYEEDGEEKVKGKEFFRRFFLFYRIMMSLFLLFL